VEDSVDVAGEAGGAVRAQVVVVVVLGFCCGGAGGVVEREALRGERVRLWEGARGRDAARRADPEVHAVAVDEVGGDVVGAGAPGLEAQAANAAGDDDVALDGPAPVCYVG